MEEGKNEGATFSQSNFSKYGACSKRNWTSKDNKHNMKRNRFQWCSTTQNKENRSVMQRIFLQCQRLDYIDLDHKIPQNLNKKVDILQQVNDVEIFEQVQVSHVSRCDTTRAMKASVRKQSVAVTTPRNVNKVSWVPCCLRPFAFLCFTAAGYEVYSFSQMRRRLSSSVRVCVNVRRHFLSWFEWMWLSGWGHCLSLQNRICVRQMDSWIQHFSQDVPPCNKTANPPELYDYGRKYNHLKIESLSFDIVKFQNPQLSYQERKLEHKSREVSCFEKEAKYNYKISGSKKQQRPVGFCTSSLQETNINHS